MKWDDRVSKYWSELPEVEAALAGDGEDLGRLWQLSGTWPEENARWVLGDKTVDVYGLFCRGCMQYQRSVRRGREFFGFLSLPAEIRRIIYDELLAVGDVFVPNGTWSFGSPRGPAIPLASPLTREQVHDARGACYHRYRDFCCATVARAARCRYTPGLLQGVCKTVQREADHVFWSQNRFIFPYSTFVAPRGFSGYYTQEEDDAWSYMPLARDLSYTFDMRAGRRSLFANYSGPALDIRSSRDELDVDLRVLVDATKLRRDAIHGAQVLHLEESWRVTAGAIKRRTKLRRLQLDLEECFCPLGCCRMVDFVCSLFRDGWEVAVPEVIEILGWIDTHETDMIVRALETLNGVTNRERITFVE